MRRIGNKVQVKKGGIMDKYREIMELFQVANPKGYSMEEVERAAAEAGGMPLELKNFFLTYGKSPELHGLQDELVLPNGSSILLRSDYIIFFNENQGVCHAGVKKSEANLPDPPVYVSTGNITDKSIYWKKSASSVSEFLIAMYGYQASICLPYNTEEFYWISREEKEEVERLFLRRSQQIDNWLYEWNITIFGDNNQGRIALMDNGVDEDIQMQYSANTESEFKRMYGYLENIGEAI